MKRLLYLLLVGSLLLSLTACGGETPDNSEMAKEPSVTASTPGEKPQPLDPIRYGEEGKTSGQTSDAKTSDGQSSDVGESSETTPKTSDKTSEGGGKSDTRPTGEYTFPVENDAVTLKEGSAPADYMDGVMFYGDSTTYGLAAYKMFGTKATRKVWTPKSGTLALFNAPTEKLYDREQEDELSLADMAKRYQPKVLIITLGINGVSMMNESYFKTEYGKVIDIVREASPSTKIVLQTMYPLCSTYKEGKLNRSVVLQGNRWIHDLAVAKNTYFLNSYNIFLDENCYMAIKYENGGDGIHFNDTGYAKMLDFAKSHPVPLN